MDPTSLHRVDSGHLSASRKTACAESDAEQPSHDAREAQASGDKDPRAFRIFWGSYLGLLIVMVGLVLTHCVAS